MGWKRLLLDHITNRGIALQPALVHSGQHRNVVVDIIVDLHESIVVVETMQPPAPLSHTTARLGKTAPPALPDAVCGTLPKCYGRDVRRPPSTETLYLRRSLPRSCASCSSPRNSRTAAPAPSSSAHRRLARPHPFPHRTRRWPQDPGHPPPPPESVLNAFLAANHAAKAAAAAPGSHPRSESTFPWPHLNPIRPLEKLLCLVLLQNLFPPDS